jgi:hypothetical protein
MKVSLNLSKLVASLLAVLSLSSCAELNSLLGYDQGSRWYRDRTYVRTWWPSSNPRADAVRLSSVANPRVQDRHYPEQGVIYNYGVPPVYNNAGSMRAARHYSAPIYDY